MDLVNNPDAASLQLYQEIGCVHPLQWLCSSIPSNAIVPQRLASKLGLRGATCQFLFAQMRTDMRLTDN